MGTPVKLQSSGSLVIGNNIISVASGSQGVQPTNVGFTGDAGRRKESGMFVIIASFIATCVSLRVIT